MKLLCLALVIAGCMPLSALAAESPVVVELFTSEGCSSCPPADALLVKLSQMQGQNLPQVVVLGEHVDYWNGLGWKDRFSSHEFTERQQDYAQHFGLQSPYTPQMVIDGKRQIVGNDVAGVGHLIDEAAKQEKMVKIGCDQDPLGHYTIGIQAPNVKAKVFLVITEDGLSTEVKGGENGGRTLSHAGVVRELRPLGSLSNGKFEKDLWLKMKPEWNPRNVKAVVFVQENDFGPIIGAAYLLGAR